ncbi:MFS transporter [Amycolatopsis sp. AA4]|nr:MFS transporter [Amycolatopsis sp. AA4]
MTWSMLPLFLLGALGPDLLAEFGITTPLLGVLVSVGFAVAAALSLTAGPVVAAVGARRGLVALFVLAGIALAAFAAAPGYGVLVLAVAASGVPQALANPVTNHLIATRVPAGRRGGVTGWKQSGVQFGAFVAGLPLAALAGAANWRIAVGVAAAIAFVAGLLVLALPADPAPASRPRWTTARPTRDAAWLCGFSALLGSGISAVNTYVALFGARQLALPVGAASALVAVLGIAGIAGRVGWSRLAARSGEPGSLLPPLAVGAAVAALALVAAAGWGAWWAWAAVTGLGVCAVSANAVSMVTVISTSPKASVAQDSAVVSAGFFAGFALGPPVAGALVDAAGGRYQYAWTTVAAEFLAAGVTAWWWRGREARP